MYTRHTQKNIRTAQERVVAEVGLVPHLDADGDPLCDLATQESVQAPVRNLLLTAALQRQLWGQKPVRYENAPAGERSI